MQERRQVSVFGATGSIGQNTLDLLRRAGGREAFRVVALTGGSNIAQLARDAVEFGAECVVTAHEERAADLRAALGNSDAVVLAGREGLLEAAGMPTDWAMSAIVGAAGLGPTMALAQSTRTLALANKESLVCAGSLLKAACAKHKTRLLPVDSEHSAIFQALEGQDRASLERIILTASGGPFRGFSRAEMAEVSLEEAQTHPNWSMGQRITIDSASMFNKALEIIETKHLFEVQPAQIEVIVHPQSIVHSMVGYRDGAILAQLGPPDMRGAIGYALNWPERSELPVERLDFGALGQLDFETPDSDSFPALGLAKDALENGGASGCVFNASKEAALDAFIDREIPFLAMADVVAHALEKLGDKAAKVKDVDGIKAIHLLDAEARRVSQDYIAALAS